MAPDHHGRLRGKKSRNGGLQMKDIETGRFYVFSNGNYNLPWSKENFLDEAIVYQKTGVIGLRLGNRRKIKAEISEALYLLSPEVKVREKDGILFIFTNEDKTDDPPAAVWKKVTRALKKVLK